MGASLADANDLDTVQLRPACDGALARMREPVTTAVWKVGVSPAIDARRVRFPSPVAGLKLSVGVGSLEPEKTHVRVRERVGLTRRV
jgi:hypothetical protein